MFTFPLSAVRAVVARGEEDAAANGGFRSLQPVPSPGKDENPGLWLVSGDGVHIMSNGRLADGASAMIHYARECGPDRPPYWSHDQHEYFEGVDSVEFLSVEHILALAETNPAATDLIILVSGNIIELLLLLN